MAGDICNLAGFGRIDFDAVNAAALRDLPALLARWLPDGEHADRLRVLLDSAVDVTPADVTQSDDLSGSTQQQTPDGNTEDETVESTPVVRDAHLRRSQLSKP